MGYGTSHLKMQGSRLGEILRSEADLVIGEPYCIADPGLNEWNSGYKFIGKEGSDFVFEDQFDNPTMVTKCRIPEEDMTEMIADGMLATEAS